MQEAIAELAAIKQSYQQQLAGYGSLTASMRAQAQAQARQTIRHMRELLGVFRAHEDDPQAAQALELYRENTQLLQQFTRLSSSDPRLSTDFQTLSAQPPPPPPQSGDGEFAGNLRQLKGQLAEIHTLLSQTSEQASISAMQALERQQVADVSRMAVHQMKATLQTQNRVLTGEVQELKDALDRMQAENRDLKQRLVDQTSTAEEATALQEETKSNLEALFKRYGQVKGERDDFKRQLEDLQTKYALFVKQQQLQDHRESISRESKYNQAIELQTENGALRAKLEKLTEEVERYRKYDIDTANSEIKRAAQTVAQMNQVIVALRQQIVDQKVAHAETVENLKTTIAALHEELFEEGDDPQKLPRAILEQKVVDLHEQNQRLQAQVQELERKASKLASAPGSYSAMVLAKRPENAVGAVLYGHKESQEILARISRTSTDEDLEKVVQQARGSRPAE